jgi:hypothetical protein
MWGGGGFGVGNGRGINKAGSACVRQCTLRGRGPRGADCGGCLELKSEDDEIGMESIRPRNGMAWGRRKKEGERGIEMAGELAGCTRIPDAMLLLLFPPCRLAACTVTLY